MAKILLVEDDNNLREIYEARLQAEGYDIVSAQDGEEALVKAKQEKPDLVISDVMMPRISGFEMLDILRNTEGLKNTKVIMLTALGQAEDKTRADSLGADRYLVKSQVTLEDIVKAAGELLSPNAGSTSAEAPSQAPTTTAATGAAAPVIAAATAGQPATPDEPVAATTPAAVATAVPATTTAQAQPTLAAIPVAAAPSLPGAPSAMPPQPTAQVPEPTVQAIQPAPTQTPVAEASNTPASGEPSTSTTEPTVAAQPVTPTPVAQPVTPATSEPKLAAEPEAPNASPQADNDKLISDAVRNLTADLSKPSNPQAAPLVTAASTPEPTTQEASAEAPTAPEVTAATKEVEAQTETPQVDDGAVITSEAEPASEPEAPDTSTDTTEVETTDDTSEVTEAPQTGEAESASAPEPTEGDTTPAEPEQVATPQPEVTPAPEPTTPEAPKPQPQVPQNTISTADEQALMQAQIDDFIKQQDTSKPKVQAEPAVAPEPTEGDTTPAEPSSDVPAVETPAETPAETSELTTGTNTQPAAEVIQPTPGSTAASQVAPEPARQEQDDVSIAHKKIIQPPVEPITPQPDLSELLAKEGITSLDDVHSGEPSAQPASPHQPGHVITPGSADTPNSFNPEDPNNIAL